MRNLFSAMPSLRVTVPGITIEWELPWLIVVPLGLWAIAIEYVAVLGAFLSLTQTWAVAALIVVLIGLSLVLHALAHVAAARWSQGLLPATLPLYPFGDAAQVWPPASSPGREVLGASAGPLASVLLAGVGYLLWNAQLDPYLNTAMPFFGLFNAALALFNVAPFYPFDGGRLARAIVWGLLGRPAASTRLVMRFGFLVAALLAAWGIALFAQPVRFHEQTGLSTLGLAALVLLALALHKARGWEGRAGEGGTVPAAFAPIAGGLFLVMLAVSSILVPVNNGLEAPGVALSVEPMVVVPPEYRHEPSGTFILTSVIQQAPITFGEWVFGQLSPAVRIVPPDVIVPPDTTPQEQARQGFRMLDESEVTASVVGLRLAGYDARAEGKGVLVDSVLQDSPAQGLLQPGDVIDGLNGEPVRSRDDLVAGLAAQSPGDTAAAARPTQWPDTGAGGASDAAGDFWRSAPSGDRGGVGGCLLHAAVPGQDRAAEDRGRAFGRPHVYADGLQCGHSERLDGWQADRRHRHDRP